MEAFPAFFPLRGARIVIAGEGQGAEAKATLLAASPVEVVRIIGAAAHDSARYAGAKLAFVADDDPLFRRLASQAARGAGVPVNVVDEPALCDFHTPAIIDRGAVVAAVGAAGAAPMLLSLLRSRIEMMLAPGVGAAAELLGHRREAIRAAFPELPRRRAFLRRLLAGSFVDLAIEAPAGAGAMLEDALASGAEPPAGMVSIILAPTAPDLLSIGAYRDLASADALFAGDGLEWLAALGRRDVERLAPAQAVATALAAKAREGSRLAVLLKAVPAGFTADIEAAGAPARIHSPAPP